MHDEPGTVKVRILGWEDARAAALPLRLAVFVAEQGVPLDLEVDELDPVCEHAIAITPAGRVLGTARLHLSTDAPARIGRMAVLRESRGRGLGRLLLETLIRRARDAGAPSVVLHAQTQALGFYARAGFIAHGPVFDDAGIPHREMRLVLDPAGGLLNPREPSADD